MAAACAAGPAHAVAPPRSVFQDDQTLLRSGEPVRERALDELDALGVDAIRVLVVWRDTNAGSILHLDALVAGAQRRGMDVLLTPTGPGPRGVTGPDPAAFGAFVRGLGARYPGVRHWAVWNEPNNPRWLRPQFSSRGRPLSPRLYRRLVGAAAAALRATGHGGDELLAGETAPIGQAAGPWARRPMMPGMFLRALLCRGCPRLPATGLSHHAYTRGGSMPPRFPALRGELSVAALGELVRIAGRLPVHLTEGGWQTTPPDPVFGVGLGAQASHLNELEWIVRGHPRVRSVPQYLLLDEVRSSGFQSGLRFADGRVKPALAAYRLPVWAVRRGARATVWGRVRPAPAGGSAGVVEVQRRLPGARHWRTVARARADDDVLVRLRSARAAWRLRWGAHVSRTASEQRR